MVAVTVVALPVGKYVGVAVKSIIGAGPGLGGEDELGGGLDDGGGEDELGGGDDEDDGGGEDELDGGLDEDVP